jgi:hypothetical protein
LNRAIELNTPECTIIKYDSQRRTVKKRRGRIEGHPVKAFFISWRVQILSLRVWGTTTVNSMREIVYKEVSGTGSHFNKMHISAINWRVLGLCNVNILE